MGRPGPGLGHHLHGHGGGGHPGLHLRLHLRGGRRAGVRRHHPARQRRPQGALRQAAAARGDLRGRVPDRAQGRLRLLRRRNKGRGPGRPLPAQRRQALHRGGRGGRLLFGLRPHRLRPGHATPQGAHLLRGRPHRGRQGGVSVRAHGLSRRRHRAPGLPRCARAAGEHRGPAQRGVRGVQYHDGARAAWHRGHDHRRGAASPGRGHPLHLQAQGLRPEDPRVPGGLVPGGRGRHPAGRQPGPGAHHRPGRGRRR